MRPHIVLWKFWWAYPVLVVLLYGVVRQVNRLVKVVERVFLGTKAKVTVLVEPQREGVPVGHQEPLADVKFTVVYQQWPLWKTRPRNAIVLETKETHLVSQIFLILMWRSTWFYYFILQFWCSTSAILSNTRHTYQYIEFISEITPRNSSPTVWYVTVKHNYLYLPIQAYLCTYLYFNYLYTYLCTSVQYICCPSGPLGCWQVSAYLQDGRSKQCLSFKIHHV